MPQAHATITDLKTGNQLYSQLDVDQACLIARLTAMQQIVDAISDLYDELRAEHGAAERPRFSDIQACIKDVLKI